MKFGGLVTKYFNKISKKRDKEDKGIMVIPELVQFKEKHNPAPKRRSRPFFWAV